MRFTLALVSFGGICLVVFGCGGSSSSPTSLAQTSAGPTPPVAQFQIRTLVTVYTKNDEYAQWTEGTTTEERIGLLLSDTQTLAPGTTVYNNEERRVLLQAAIERIVKDFNEQDYISAFGESKENLQRFFNDTDNDGWSIDGRFGVGRDWPFDSNGNDPDGWTGQIIVIVSRP